MHKKLGGVWAENPMPFDSLNYKKERNAVLFSSWFKRVYIYSTWKECECTC